LVADLRVGRRWSGDGEGRDRGAGEHAGGEEGPDGTSHCACSLGGGSRGDGWSWERSHDTLQDNDEPEKTVSPVGTAGRSPSRHNCDMRGRNLHNEQQPDRMNAYTFATCAPRAHSRHSNDIVVGAGTPWPSR